MLAVILQENPLGSFLVKYRIDFSKSSIRGAECIIRSKISKGLTKVPENNMPNFSTKCESGGEGATPNNIAATIIRTKGILSSQLNISYSPNYSPRKQSYFIYLKKSRHCQIIALFVFFVAIISTISVQAKGIYTETPYKSQKVVFELYFDEPEKLYSALFWLRSFVNPLTEQPYNLAVESHNIILVSHGREIVVFAKKNYSKYKTTVARLRYYTDRGVKIKVCALAMKDFGYSLKDFYDFVEVVPSAIVELSHWQSKGYSLIWPRILEKKSSNEEIR